MVNVTGLAPLVTPTLQPIKTDFQSAVAKRVTGRPVVKLALQSSGLPLRQLIPCEWSIRRPARGGRSKAEAWTVLLSFVTMFLFQRKKQKAVSISFS
jgi:hypothetical protein